MYASNYQFFPLLSHAASLQSYLSSLVSAASEQEILGKLSHQYVPQFPHLYKAIVPIS